MLSRKIIKQSLWTVFFLFILVNIVAINHAYRFTHFSNNSSSKTSENLSLGDKLSALAMGISNPRPVNKSCPTRKFQTVNLESNKRIECWLIPADSSNGTVILFHGYGGEKFGLLDKAEVFSQLGYSCLLVDFMGSGGSEGTQTTIGYDEAKEVEAAYGFVQSKGEQNIILFGTSMGAVAIMKAIHDRHLTPTSIILECPFGSMLKTVRARFNTMNVPAFPMANLLVFWGGALNHFNAFNHNPSEYSLAITCPTLLMYGEQDKKVSREEIDTIFNHLKGQKTLALYHKAGHENYLTQYAKQWTKDIQTFLETKSVR